jgi:predicted nucleotidyltransferase
MRRTPVTATLFGVAKAETKDSMAAMLEEVVKALVRAANPEGIWIFGSAATGATRPGSDLDLLVVEGADFGPACSRREETARLRRALPRLSCPVDLLVVSQSEANRWRRSRNHVVARAQRQGRQVYERP